MAHHRPTTSSYRFSYRPSPGTPAHELRIDDRASVVAWIRSRERPRGTTGALQRRSTRLAPVRARCRGLREGRRPRPRRCPEPRNQHALSGRVLPAGAGSRSGRSRRRSRRAARASAAPGRRPAQRLRRRPRRAHRSAAWCKWPSATRPVHVRAPYAGGLRTLPRRTRRRWRAATDLRGVSCPLSSCRPGTRTACRVPVLHRPRVPFAGSTAQLGTTTAPLSSFRRVAPGLPLGRRTVTPPVASARMHALSGAASGASRPGAAAYLRPRVRSRSRALPSPVRPAPVDTAGA